MRSSPRVTLSVLVAVLVATPACKDPSDPSDPNPGSGSRLAWTQPAASVTQLRGLTFRLYVDNAPASLTGVRCNETLGTTGYECSAGLPPLSGPHTLQLASILGGVESPRSAALSMTFGTKSVAESVQMSSTNDAPSAADPVPMCVSASTSQTCDTPRLVSATLRGASSLTAIPDGRLLFVERDSLVRVVAEGALVPEAALALENPSSRIVGLAVDPRFESSRSVFVAWTSVSRNGVELNITRYRELQHALGEGATVASGLPFEHGLRAPLVVDGDGLLYVAVPSTPRAPSAILRLTRDGFVPRSNATLLPAIGGGFARPADLAIDVTTRRVWISGTDPIQPYSVVTFASFDELARQSAPEPVLARVDADDAPTLAVLRRSAHDPMASLLVARGGQLFRGDITPGIAAESLRRLPVEPDVPILSIAEGPAGSFYVLTGTMDGAQSLFQLLPH